MEILQRRLLSKKKSTSLLPKEYQQVEYIESSGGAFIDTCQSGNNFPSFKMRAMLLDSTPLGSYSDIERNAIWGNNGKLRLCVYSRLLFQHGNYSANTATQPYLNKWVDMEGGYGYFTIDDNTFPFTQQAKDYTEDSINLFKARTAQEGRPYRIASYQSFDGENEPILVRDYVACYRKNDGVVGLYDLSGSICPLTGTPFYINAGAGEFIKGDDVNAL
jgi:hypothetical protein